jgi:altronate dehydratase small subunit
MSELDMTDSRLLFLNPNDNVCTAISPIASGVTLYIKGKEVLLEKSVPLGFKIASCNIAIGETIVKYGVSIGSATRNIAPGELVHVHNMKSDYLPTYTLSKEGDHDWQH